MLFFSKKYNELLCKTFSTLVGGAGGEFWLLSPIEAREIAKNWFV